MLIPTSAKAAAAGLLEWWSPLVVAELDDVYVKVAKAKGKFVWHSHDNEDELFFILQGRLRIEMEEGAIDLNEGEMFVVPRLVRHCPVAFDECHILLIERKSTLHTGSVISHRTRSLQEQLSPNPGGREATP